MLLYNNPLYTFLVKFIYLLPVLENMGEVENLYQLVQFIPYRLGFIDDIDFESNCVTKSIAFERNYPGTDSISYIDVKFDWRKLLDWEEMERISPKAKEEGIATLVKELENPIDDHLVLRMGDYDPAIYVDTSWDPTMWNLGFPKREYGEGIALPKEAIIDVNPTFFDVPRYKVNRAIKKARRLFHKPEMGRFNLAFNLILDYNITEQNVRDKNG